jgi:tRNA threonylcarbamoyladenosine biosynthesis protein TsaE
MDLYRIPNLEDFEMLGAEELLYDDQAVSLIEWSAVIDEILPDYTIRVSIEILENQDRGITIEGALL